MTNHPDLSSDKKDISLEVSKYCEEGMRLIGNNNDDIRPVNINQQKPTTPN